MTETTIDGTRIYIDETGRQFFADQYDKMFKPSHNIKMKSDKKHKGDNICRNKAWIKDKKSY